MSNADFILEDLLAQDVWIRALARRLVADEHTAEDLAQDAWVETIAKSRRLSVPMRFWLGRVVRNLAAMRHRSDMSRHEREQAAAKPESLPSVAEMWGQEQVRRTVATAVFSLEEPYRSAILYRYFRSLPPREIADRLGVTVAAVEGRLRRGLQKLRARLDREFGDRRSWCAALLPLIGKVPAPVATAAGGATTASIITGALVMSTKIKIGIGIAAVLVAATAIAFWPRAEEPQTLPPPKEPAAALGATTGAGEQRQPTPSAAAVPVVATGQPGEKAATPATASTPVGRLSGRITVIGSGEPCSEAVVKLFRERPGRDLSRRFQGGDGDLKTETTRGGAYRFAAVPPGTYRIRIHPLCQPIAHTENVAIEICAGEETARDFEIGAGIRVRGVVKERETDRPIAGVEVWHWENPRQVAVTDAEGRFEVVGVEPQMLMTRDFDLRAEGHIRSTMKEPRVSASSPYVTIFMERGATVSGRVLGPDGMAYAGATVFGQGGKVVTDKAGRFVLEHQHVSPPENALHVEAKEYPRANVKFKLEPGETKSDIVVQLRQGGDVAGRVTDDEGHAVAEAKVGLSGDSGFGSGRTDEAGRFLITRVAPGSYRLHVRTEGELMDAARPGVVVSPGSRIEVNVTLRRGAELTGVVVDEHQRPIQGARVSASATGVHGDRRSGETDAEGVFRISGLPPGMLAELFVAKRGYASAWLKQDLTTGMSNLTITLQKPIALRGRVVHVGSRAPAKDFWVKLLSSERIGPRRERPPGPRPYLPPQRFFTDPDGRFSTPVWEPGIYCIAAGTKDGKRSRPVEVRIESEREAEPAELVLEPGAAIHGLILDTSGRIVEGAQVHACAFLGNGRYSLERAASDEKGHYQFLGLGSGPHLLRAFVPGDVEWEATTAVDLAPGNRLTVNLTLERCGTLEVRVLGRTDEPVERVAVVTHRTFGAQDFELGYLAEKHSEEVDGARFFLTDASGCTLPRHLPPGTYTVVAAVMPPGPISLLFLRDNSDAVRQTVTVAPGQTTRIDIRLGRRDGPQDRSRESR